MSRILELEDKVSTAASQEDKCDSMIQLAWELRSQDVKRTDALSREALVLALDQNYLKGQAYALRNIAFVNQQFARYDESCDLAYKALDIFEHVGDELGQASVYNTLGINYYRLGDFENSLLIHMKALKKREDAGDLAGVGASLINLGNVYSSLQDYDNSLKFFNRGIKITEQNNDTLGRAAIINNIGTVYILKKDFEQAKPYFEESIRIKNELEDHRGLGISYSNLADCYLESGDFDLAERYLLDSLEIHQKWPSPSGEGLSLLGLAKAKAGKKEYAEALRILSRALSLYEDLELRDGLIDVNEGFASVYSKLGEFENAFHHQQKHNELLKEAFEEETRKKIGNMQLLHQMENLKHEAEIHRLKNVELKKLNEEVEEKNKEITDSINYAQLIQKAMLPDPSEIQRAFTEAFVFFQPRNIVSGDFYWFHRFNIAEAHSRAVLVLADCTGHGVPGAFMSMIGNTVLNQLVIEKGIYKPAILLKELDSKVRSMLKQYQHGSGSRDGMDIAICFIDPQNGVLEYSGANRPVIVHSGNEITELDPDKFSIGGFHSEEKTFNGTTIRIKPGDVLYMYSDGLVDQFGGADEKIRGGGGKKFLAKRFLKFVEDNARTPLIEQQALISETFNDWKGELEQTDDVCLLAVKI